MTDLDPIRAIVRTWRDGVPTELSAARAMREIAGLLGIQPPEPVAGKRRDRTRVTEQANPSTEIDTNVLANAPLQVQDELSEHV